jgi:hypothetical protein
MGMGVNKYLRLFLMLALIGLPCSLMAENALIKVASQEQFDAAVARINSGEETHIVLKKGTYILRTSINATAPLSIKGKNATITCATQVTSKEIVRQTETHYVYKLDRPLSPFALFYDKNGKLLPISESVIDSVKVNYIDGEIEGPQEYKAGEKIKIPISSNLIHLKNKVFSCAYGYYDCGWKAVSFQMERSDDKYFYCTTLSDCPTKNYQYDKVAYKKPIRYVIYNAEKKENAIFFEGKDLYIPKDISVLYYLSNNDSVHLMPTITVSKAFDLENVKFIGLGTISVDSKKSDVCIIKNCIFQNSRSYALKIKKENGENAVKAMVTGCIFKECSVYTGNVVRLTSTFYGPSCIIMQRCMLSRYSDGNVIYKNTSESVYVSGDVEIKDNVMCNSCRGHLFLYKGNINVSGNILYNTDSFNALPERNYSNDWGFVYCGYLYKDTSDALNNKQHHILSEKNLCYGAYAYGGDARGIFIDDGRGDVTCKNNVILNIQMYSIDSRNVKMHDAASARNKYEGNIVSSAYRLEAGPALKDADRPVASGNILISSKENKISNTEILEKDRRLDLNASSSCDGTKIRIKKDLYKVLKKHPSFGNIKKCL